METNNVLKAAMMADYIMEENTDAYKETHWMQYPKGTTELYGYLESRGGMFHKTVFFGLQYYLKKYFAGSVITNETVDEAITDCEEIFGHKFFNEKGWRFIANECTGKLPIEIKAVPEGLPVPTRNVLMTVRNTKPEAFFVPMFFEGLLEMIWYPTTVATLSREIKKELEGWAVKTGEHVSIVHLNDFGFRASTSLESAGIGGMAHLINFAGSDTIIGKRFANKYYNAKLSKQPVLLSVYAAEHSTVTSYGKYDEVTAYCNILDNAPSDAIVSMVVDSYDAMRAVDEYFGTNPLIKDRVMKRTAKTVLRPDSGDPVWMSVEILNSLWKNYKGTINEMGFKVLDPHVGVIYGDYMSLDMIRNIMYEVVQKNRFAPSNIVFGMGGSLLQKVNRDTQSFAYKCSSITVNNKTWDVFKRPISDARKESKRGKLSLAYEDGIYTTIKESCVPGYDVMKTVFRDGEVLIDYTFDEVRERAKIPDMTY